MEANPDGFGKRGTIFPGNTAGTVENLRQGIAIESVRR
jgi:hypothetical protein